MWCEQSSNVIQWFASFGMTLRCTNLPHAGVHILSDDMKVCTQECIGSACVVCRKSISIRWIIAIHSMYRTIELYTIHSNHRGICHNITNRESCEWHRQAIHPLRCVRCNTPHTCHIWIFVQTTVQSNRHDAQCADDGMNWHDSSQAEQKKNVTILYHVYRMSVWSHTHTHIGCHNCAITHIRIRYRWKCGAGRWIRCCWILIHIRKWRHVKWCSSSAKRAVEIGH